MSLVSSQRHGYAVVAHLHGDFCRHVSASSLLLHLPAHPAGAPSIARTSLRVTMSVMGSSGDGSKPRAR